MVSRSLADRAQKFVLHKYLDRADSDTLNILSPSLEGAVRLEQAAARFCRSKIFATVYDLNRACAGKISLAFKNEAFEPAHILFQSGAFVDGCHVRIRGSFARLANQNSIKTGKTRGRQPTAKDSQKFNQLMRYRRAQTATIDDTNGIVTMSTELIKEDSFNEIALFCADFVATQTVVAASFSTVLFLSADAFYCAVREYPDCWHAVITYAQELIYDELTGMTFEQTERTVVGVQRKVENANFKAQLHQPNVMEDIKNGDDRIEVLMASYPELEYYDEYPTLFFLTEGRKNKN